MILKYLFLFALVLSMPVAHAQTDASERGNLPFYYHKKMHFGVALGINNTSFLIQPAGHSERLDSLKSVTSGSGSGFNLGVISELRLHQYLTLRFIPTYVFTERVLDFYFEGKKDNISKTKSIESAFLNFPIDVKLRSKRVENFSAYILAGGGYNLDLASKRKFSNADLPINEQVVKLKRDDFFYEAGGGAEFYLRFVKLTIEAKISLGMRNMLIKDNTIFATSIDKLRSKMVLICLTFET